MIRWRLIVLNSNASVIAGITFLLGSITSLLGVASFYIARKKDTANDVKSTVEQNTKINWKLDQLCDDTRTMRVDMQTQYKGIDTKLDKLNEEVIVLTRDQKTLFTRHDENKHDIKRLDEEVQELKNRIVRLEAFEGGK
jgi:predicted phage-related endonuclease